MNSLLSDLPKSLFETEFYYNYKKRVRDVAFEYSMWRCLIIFVCHKWLKNCGKFVKIIEYFWHGDHRTFKSSYWLTNSINRTRRCCTLATWLGDLCRDLCIRELSLKGRCITVQLSSCLVCSELPALLMLNEHRFYLVGQVQTSQTGGQPYSDTFPNGKFYLTGLKTLTLISDVFVCCTE